MLFSLCVGVCNNFFLFNFVSLVVFVVVYFPLGVRLAFGCFLFPGCVSLKFFVVFFVSSGFCFIFVLHSWY